MTTDAPEEVPEDRGRSERQVALKAALEKVSSTLGGLYERALDIRWQLDLQGNVHLLAHAARELSCAVIRFELANLPGREDPYQEREEAEQAEEEEESNRFRIARALELPSEHPIVQDWSKTHRTLQGAVHVSDGGRVPDHNAVRGAFARLEDLLHMVLGLYVTGHRELERLLQVEVPSDADIVALRGILGRKSLRVRFYQELGHVGWLDPLLQANLLLPPPDPKGVENPEWAPWPEARYLSRLAADHGPTVVDVIGRIPSDTKNQFVAWEIADIVPRMPATEAAPLTRRLAKALRKAQWPSIPVKVGACAEHFARGGENKAASSLFRELVRVDASSGGFKHFDHDLGRVCVQQVIEAGDQDFAWKALRILVAKVRAVAKAQAGEDGAFDRSRVWAVPLMGPKKWKSGPGPMLLVEATKLALRLAEDGDSAVEDVLGILEPTSVRAIDRLRAVVLAEHGGAVPDVRDRAVAAAVFAEHIPYGDAEYAYLVRQQFPHAGQVARDRFVAAVVCGPQPSHGSLAEGVLEDSEEGREHKDKSRAAWQARRLWWLGPHVPEALSAMRDTLAELIPPGDPWGEGQFSSASWLPGEREETQRRDEFLELSRGDQVEQLKNWRSEEDQSPFVICCTLGASAEDLIASAPSEFQVALEEPASTYHPHIVQHFLSGLRKAVVNRVDVPVRGAVQFAASVVSAYQVDAQDVWGPLARDAVDVVGELARGKTLPADYLDASWRIVSGVADKDETWSGVPIPLSEDHPELVEERWNTNGAYISRAAVLIGWLEKDLVPSDRPDRLVGVLENALAREGPAAEAARGEIGGLLPWVFELAPEWTKQNLDRLFRDGVSIERPGRAWERFLETSGLSGDRFASMRDFYRRSAARQERETGGASLDESRTVALHGNLRGHILGALLRGDIEVDDPDGLPDLVFDNTTVGRRSDLYMGMYRAWQEGNFVVDEDVAARLLAVWSWRVGRLEKSRDGEEASALLWLFQITDLPSDEALGLLRRTTRIAKTAGDEPLWDRLNDLFAENEGAASEVAKNVIAALVRSEYPGLHEETGMLEVLRKALASEDQAVVSDATEGVNDLAEHISSKYLDLLERGEQ